MWLLLSFLPDETLTTAARSSIPLRWCSRVKCNANTDDRNTLSCKYLHWTVQWVHISLSSVFTVPVSVMTTTALRRMCLCFPFCRVAALMCLCTICTMLVPIMDPGLSLLRSPRLTALSCQTNEHARKQRKSGRKWGGGCYERSGMEGGAIVRYEKGY